MKKACRILSLLAVLAAVLSMLTMSGCNSSIGDPPITTINYYKTVMNYSPFKDMPDITVEQVLTKYMDEPGGTYGGTNGKYTVDTGGTITSLNQEVRLKFTVTDDPEDKTICYITLDKITLDDEELDSEASIDYMYELFSAYQAGCDDLSQWQGSAPESSSNNTNEITEQDRKIIEDAGFEWVEPITVKDSNITGVIRNVSGNVLSGSIQFNLYDESGYQLGEAYDTIADIADGESWRFKATIMDIDNEVRSYKLISLSMMQF